MPIVQMLLLGFIVFATLVILYFVPVGMWIQGIVSFYAKFAWGNARNGYKNV